MDILNGFTDALSFANILYVFLGVGLGVIVGAIPGLSGPIAIAMLVPITYFMPTIGAIGFLVGINKGGCFGGSITAILLNTPGAPEATATTFDGYPLAKQGKGLKAMKVALMSSVIGDIFSTILVIAVAASIASAALHMGPTEVTAILILALTLIAALESESFLNGVIAACFGLFISTIGMEPVTFSPRFTFGFFELESGIPVAALALGFLAVSELIRQCVESSRAEDCGLSQPETKVEKDANRLSVKEGFSLIPTWIRSSFIGAGIGACPGLGSTVAAFLSYGVAKKSAKSTEKFGQGELKGVAAPETASNAVIGAALIPLFTLGIPGSVAASLLVGAFIVHGITPGPLMFEEHGRAVYGIYGSMIVGSIATLILGYMGIRVFVKVLCVPKRILYPVIIFICIMGAYILESDPFHVYVMIAFTILGILMRIARFSFVAFIIGFVLGNLFEMSLQQMLITFNNDLTVLFTRPVSCVVMIMTLLFIAYNFYRYLRKPKQGSMAALVEEGRIREMQ